MRVLAFGEVLWDVYPHKKVIGGATLNFAGSIVALGAQATLLSAVGNDKLGKEARTVIRKMKIDDSMLLTVDNPTGVCLVTVDAYGNPSYELKKGMAYDNIALMHGGDAVIAGAAYDALYFGTLAQRNYVSRSTLKRVLSVNSFNEVFYDINIRQSWYSREIIEYGLRACTTLKVSREEAEVFREIGILRAEPCMSEDDYLRLMCRYLSRFYAIPTVLVTLDKDGAFVYDAARDEFFFSDKPRVKVVSTVGGGDSFSAAYLYYRTRGDEVSCALKKAVAVSGYVVGSIESVPALPRELLDSLEVSVTAAI